jgi:hypothetical protein
MSLYVLFFYQYWTGWYNVGLLNFQIADIIIIIIMIIIVIIIIPFMQSIHTYVPETNHVSRVYSVAAIPRILLMVYITLSSIWKLLCASTLALSTVCVLCPI